MKSVSASCVGSFYSKEVSSSPASPCYIPRPSAALTPLCCSNTQAATARLAFDENRTPKNISLRWPEIARRQFLAYNKTNFKMSEPRGKLIKLNAGAI